MFGIWLARWGSLGGFLIASSMAAFMAATLALFWPASATVLAWLESNPALLAKFFMFLLKSKSAVLVAGVVSSSPAMALPDAESVSEAFGPRSQTCQSMLDPRPLLSHHASRSGVIRLREVPTHDRCCFHDDP